MYQVDFNPVTIAMEMTLSEDTCLRRWADISSFFFNAYAQEVTKKGKTYIGHIKVLALVDENTSFKLSIYKPSIPAAVDINGDIWISKLSLLVNSFVYGVDEEESIAVLESVAKQMEKKFLLRTSYKSKRIHHHS